MEKEHRIYFLPYWMEKVALRRGINVADTLNFEVAKDLFSIDDMILSMNFSVDAAEILFGKDVNLSGQIRDTAPKPQLNPLDRNVLGSDQCFGASIWNSWINTLRADNPESKRVWDRLMEYESSVMGGRESLKKQIRARIELDAEDKVLYPKYINIYDRDSTSSVAVLYPNTVEGYKSEAYRLEVMTAIVKHLHSHCPTHYVAKTIFFKEYLALIEHVEIIV